jgi:precorrin-6A/cobalt-precorrin-6A reductase
MRLLMLAGTHDSVQIAGALAREHRVAAIASMARAARAPIPLGLPTRIGGWGGEEAFVDWLRRERVHAILDATHPFAVTISGRALRAAEELGLDYLRFQRPPWIPGPEDRWTFLNSCGEIAQKLPVGARVLIDTDGRGNEAAGQLDGRVVFCRVSEVTPGAEARRAAWRFLTGGGTPAYDEEIRLYTSLNLDWIVLPNVGGVEESAKLEAARRLGIQLGIVRRPPQREAPRAETVSEVMRWVRRRL